MRTMVGLAKSVDRLTTKHLEVVIQVLAKLPPPVIADETFLTYGLATEVLRFFFGNAWTNENVFSVHTDISSPHRAGRKFLKTESIDNDDQFRHMQRVTTLAEVVFNLQGVEGLKQRISLMHNHDLEAALGEMECAALLAVPDLHFRFIEPTGVKGQDYEGEIVASSGRIVCCEIKSRSEETIPSQGNLWNTIEHARKQLPKGKPAIVLMKIPEGWVKQPNIQTVVEAATEKVFRQSHRITAVVFTWEEWNSAPQGSKLVVPRIRPYPNKRSNMYQDDIDAILSSIGRAGNPSWVNFHRLAIQIRAAA